MIPALPLFGGIPGGPELIIIFLLFGILGVLIPVGAAYWVYQDAQARGNDDATLWAIVTLAGGLFAWLVGVAAAIALYVLVGRD
ncbi:PLDc N-terminal domain-containing protein [Halobaculum sp. P14]|uniref:PLDc N-terminal domain-containing protein n=1 Tax=Halobaculum sp. P14 TaxID=3421638 RepID=UPI003EB7E677